MLRLLGKRVTITYFIKLFRVTRNTKVVLNNGRVGDQTCGILNGFSFKLVKEAMDGLGTKQCAIPTTPTSYSARRVAGRQPTSPPNNQKRDLPGMSHVFCVLALDWFHSNLCYAHWSNVLLKRTLWNYFV